MPYLLPYASVARYNKGMRRNAVVHAPEGVIRSSRSSHPLLCSLAHLIRRQSQNGSEIYVDEQSDGMHARTFANTEVGGHTVYFNSVPSGIHMSFEDVVVPECRRRRRIMQMYPLDPRHSTGLYSVQFVYRCTATQMYARG